MTLEGIFDVMLIFFTFIFVQNLMHYLFLHNLVKAVRDTVHSMQVKLEADKEKND